MPGPVFDMSSRWELEGNVSELAEILSDPLSLAEWWAPVFMRVELIDAGSGAGVGTSARFFTKGFMPHTFQFVAEIVKLDELKSIVIRTKGDFDGVCTIEIHNGYQNSVVDIRWRVEVYQPYLRMFLYPLKPLFIANHRWAMRHGRRGLQEEIYRRRGHGSSRKVKPTFPHNLSVLHNRFRWSKERLHSGGSRWQL